MPEARSMTKKAWGKTQQLFNNSSTEVHRIEVVRGGYCSIHEHTAKLNLFFVEFGELRVTTFGRNLQPIQCHTIRPGKSFTVASGTLHQFEATEPTVAYEIYSVDRSIDPEDIIRHSQGGIKA